MSALEITDLHVRLGANDVLRGVDLRVEAGTVAVVLGHSGCGKTTLLRSIAGFVDAHRGTITLADRVLDAPGVRVVPERRGIGLVPQEGALFPHLTAAENVAFGLPSRGRRRNPRVLELLDLVGLADHADRRPSQLSGGQQQRVALARALAPSPGVVLLDEPFSALDAGLREKLRVQVRTALKAVGATAIIVTHDQDEALSIADTVAVLEEGRVAMHGPPADVYTRPVGMGVARFVGQAIELPVHAGGDAVETALGSVRLVASATSARGTLVLRPEQLRLLDPSDTRGVAAEVISTSFHGHDALSRVRLTGSDTEVLVRSLGVGPQAGPARVLVDGEGVFFPDPL